MKTANLLMQENFYAGSFTWKVVADKHTVCLKPILNQKIIIIQSISIASLSIISYSVIEFIAQHGLINLSDNIQSKLFHLIPYSILIFGFIAIALTQLLEGRDIKRGPTFIYNMDTDIIEIPHRHARITPNNSTFLQYLHDSKGDSIYELNLVHKNKRFPLLRALNPFVKRIGEELADKADLKFDIYQSTGKQPFYNVATGGDS